MRYRLCTLENSSDKKKTAYLKESDAYVGNMFNVSEDEWVITSVSTTSISEGYLESLKTDQVNYDKENFGNEREGNSKCD